MKRSAGLSLLLAFAASCAQARSPVIEAHFSEQCPLASREPALRLVCRCRKLAEIQCSRPRSGICPGTRLAQTARAGIHQRHPAYARLHLDPPDHTPAQPDADAGGSRAGCTHGCAAARDADPALPDGSAPHGRMDSRTGPYCKQRKNPEHIPAITCRRQSPAKRSGSPPPAWRGSAPPDGKACRQMKKPAQGGLKRETGRGSSWVARRAHVETARSVTATRGLTETTPPGFFEGRRKPQSAIEDERIAPNDLSASGAMRAYGPACEILTGQTPRGNSLSNDYDT